MKSFLTFEFMRPTKVPTHFQIYNAPRPLPGHVTFEGEFLRGRHYCACDPADDIYLRDIEALDGWLLVEGNEPDFEDWLSAQIAYHRYSGDIESIRGPMLDEYIRKHWGREV